MTATGPDLETRILKAHAAADHRALAALYREAGDLAEASGGVDEACFFYTQAYIFALDAGATRDAAELFAILKRHGRED